MIILVEKKKEFKVGVNEVYRYVSNMENYGNWFPGVVQIKSANDLEHGQVGKAYAETVEFPEGTSELTIEVKEAKANERFVTEANFDPLQPRMTVLFSDNNVGGCHLTWSFGSRNTDLQEGHDFLEAIKLNIDERAEIGMNNLEQLLMSNGND